MTDKNKNRLYVTLQHRMEKPGFHLAIVLAPKFESTDIGVHDSHIFHATNTMQPGAAIGTDGKPLWRYEEKPANSLRSATLIGRILVAKLPTTEPLQNQAEEIDRIACEVPIIQYNDEWNCRVWVEQVLAALCATGGNFSTIPLVTPGSRNEAAIQAFGEKAMDKIRRGTGRIKSVTDLLHMDMRGK